MEHVRRTASRFASAAFASMLAVCAPVRAGTVSGVQGTVDITPTCGGPIVCPNSGGGGTVTVSAVTIPTLMTWAPLVPLGGCRNVCLVTNTSVGTEYICPMVLTGTVTQAQIDQCANTQLNSGDQISLNGVTNAFSIANDSISDCRPVPAAACRSSASLSIAQ